MNHEQRRRIRERQKQLERDNRERPAVLTKLPEEKWARLPGTESFGRIAVYVSSRFMAQVYQERDGILRVSVNRTMIRDDGKWDDRITWDELMEVKKEIGFRDRDAVEILPREYDTVNVSNMRHIWILPELIPYAWRRDGKRGR